MKTEAISQAMGQPAYDDFRLRILVPHSSHECGAFRIDTFSGECLKQGFSFFAHERAVNPTEAL